MEAADRKQFQELLEQAEHIQKELSKEGIECSRAEVLAFILWKRGRPTAGFGQIYP